MEENMEDEVKPFKTKDTALASYLHAKGMKILGTVPHESSPGVKVFVFADAPERDQLVEEYISGGGSVAPQKFTYSYKVIKRYIYEDN